MRIVIPAGFMPDSRAGLFAITLCTGQGAVMAHVNAKGEIVHHDPSKPSQPKSHDAPCAFAGAGAPVLDTPLPGLSQPSHYAAASALPSLVAVAPGRGLAAPPPPSHAPPVTLV